MKRLISIIAVTALMLSVFVVPATAATQTTFTVREQVKCSSCSQCLGLDGLTAAPCGSYIMPIWITNNGGNAESRWLTGATFEITIDGSKLEWFFPRGSAAYSVGTSDAARRSWPYVFENDALLGIPMVRPPVGEFNGNVATFDLVDIGAEKRAEAFIIAVRVKPKSGFTSGSTNITLNVKSAVGSTDPGVAVSGSISNIAVSAGKVSPFGTVPNTGIEDITGAIWVMIAFLILSAGLWTYIIRQKVKQG